MARFRLYEKANSQGIFQEAKVRSFRGVKIDLNHCDLCNPVQIIYCLTLIRVKIPARPNRIVGIHAERKG